MEMPQAVIARLKGAGAVSALVGARVYWMVRPQQDALPAIVLQTISEEQPQHLKGFEDVKTARVQVDCFAAKFSDARLLAKAAQDALVAPATVVDPAGDDVIFWRSGVEGPRDLGEQTEQGFIHRTELDVIIRYGKAS